MNKVITTVAMVTDFIELSEPQYFAHIPFGCSVHTNHSQFELDTIVSNFSISKLCSCNESALNASLWTTTNNAKYQMEHSLILPFVTLLIQI